MHFTGTKFALDSSFVDDQKKLKSYGGFLTSAMYHHKEAIQSNKRNMMKQRKGLTPHRKSDPKKKIKLNHGRPSWFQPTE